MLFKKFAEIGEFAAMGAFENEKRNLFYRKALGIRRYYENCKLCEYEGKPLYPSGIAQDSIIIKPYYTDGLSINYSKINDKNRELIQAFQNVFFKYTPKVPREHTVAGSMYCHSIPNYGRIIREGFNSYAKRIEKIADIDLREGLLHVNEGIKCYVSRCVDYLKSVNADEKLINALKKVPLEKADNIYEAIVAWNFVMYLDNCDNLGCPAKELIDFYNGENVESLLENLYDNLDMHDGYSMALNTEYNELTLQCLKAAKGKRRPMIELFVDENTPNEIWDTAFDIVRSHGGQPAFYNPKILLKGLKEKLNISSEDIKDFCGGGCIDKGKDFNDGGARYRWSIVNFAGTINVIDSLLAIKELIFDKKTETPESFIFGLKNNDSEFLSNCRRVEKAFGKDDAESNAFAHKLSHDIFSTLDTQVPYSGGKFLPASIQFMSQVMAGKGVGATPDGRSAGAPLCDSLAAIFGKDTNGPTALLKSVAALDLKSALGVPVVNFNIDESGTTTC